MSQLFPIITVPTDAAEATEAMGTKFKFWFHDPEFGYCLYKQARNNTGEDWAEKIASELCELLGLPHARYELATWNGNCGTVSPSFVPVRGSLILGNEILAPMVSDYPQFQAFNVSQHTVDIVLRTIDDDAVNLPVNWESPAGITKAVETFVGYLLLDAWIGNSDRHHENWGFIENRQESSVPSTLHLAPTFDHASCLGRELLDSKRISRLNNRTVAAYVDKCASALYAVVEDKKPLKPIEAFWTAAQRYPDSAQIWLERLGSVSPRDTLELFNRIPRECISENAIRFAQQILEINQSNLLSNTGRITLE